jgi:signal transduction histidine kinase
LHLSDLANASYIWLHIGAERITLRGQQHIILTMNDLTSRKKIESQLRQDEKMRTIGQLAAGIAHEINTPTQYINDNLHFLHDGFQDIIQLLDRYAQWAKAEKEGNLPNETHPSLEDLIQKINLSYLMEEIPGAIQQSMEGASNIGRIVQAMKQFSHPGSKEKQLVNIEQIINNTIAITRNLWKYVTEITTDFGPETPLVPCMAEKMQQVFLNLIVNAKDAIEEKFSRESGEKGLIHITARKKEEVLEIRIADNGPGIPPSIREHIFEPFFTTKEVGKGSGQGLAICHSILVEEHQGCIEVETEEGKGTTFILCLPLEVALSDAY